MCKGCCGVGGCTVHWITKILVIVGGINWGLIGLSMLLGNTELEVWNVVKMLLGSVPVAEGVVYVLVGLAAIMKIFGCKCGKCKDGVCTSCTSEEENKMQGSM